MKRLSLAALALLSACASPASMQNLSFAQQDYVATQTACHAGNQTAWDLLPQKIATMGVWQAQVTAEQDANAATGAAIGLGVLAVGLGALDAATCCNYGYHYHYHHAHWRHY